MKDLLSIRRWREAVHYAEEHGAEVRNGKGDHTIIKTDRGMFVCSASDGSEIGKGIRSKMVKAFIIMGLGAFILFQLGIL